MAEENTNAQENEKGNGKKSNGGKKRAAVILLIIFAVGAGLGGHWWIKSRMDITTDDAFIDGHVFQVSSRVPGHVQELLVHDNELVTKGSVLVKLDTSDYRTQVAQAASSVSQAKDDLASDYAQLDSANANVNVIKAQLDLATKNYERGKELFKRGIIAKQDLDTLATNESVARSQLKDAEENVRKVQAQIGLLVKGGVAAAVAQRQAQLEQARLNLQYTDIKAPDDGYITMRSVEPGNYVTPGQPLMALVPLSDVWVTANYKENQLTWVQPGQPVDFTVDAYPGRVFKGHVNSIMAGTGSAFSLLPPENATGNFVKVVQRIPVKITIDKGTDPMHLLRVGMSVEPTIYTGRTAGQILRSAWPF